MLARDSSEFDPKLILAVPPPLIWIVSKSLDVRSTLISNVKDLSGALFCTGWVTPDPVRVSNALFEDITATSLSIFANLIWATVTSLSRIRESFKVTFAVDTLGIPLFQFKGFDHSLSPPPLVKVDTDTSGGASDFIFPDASISNAVSPISSFDSWLVVNPLALFPKLITSSLKPVIIILPLPQLDEELSANAIEVTLGSMLKLILAESAIVINPAFDWLLFIVKFNVLSESTWIVLFKISSEFIVILPPVFTIILVPDVLNLFLAELTVNLPFPALPINLKALACSVKSEFSPKVTFVFALTFSHLFETNLPLIWWAVLAFVFGLENDNVAVVFVNDELKNIFALAPFVANDLPWVSVVLIITGSWKSTDESSPLAWTGCPTLPLPVIVRDFWGETVILPTIFLW